ncbi:MAG TPA: hypothetical protein VMW50_03560 [Dehalococcoidia bacterium]|nr:hypothetical protein [Dehalococcoidia bacterium]
MSTTTVKFKVAMDAEQKAAKNFKEVEFECSFDGVDPSIIQRHAIANQIVIWQGQIRNNWDKFLSGKLPKIVTFGVPLFEGGRNRTRPITEDDIRAYLAGKSPEEVRAFLWNVRGGWQGQIRNDWSKFLEAGGNEVKQEEVDNTPELDEDGDPIFVDPGDAEEY